MLQTLPQHSVHNPTPPLIKNIIKLQSPLHHIYVGKHTSLVTDGDTAKMVTIVKLFRLPLEKTFLYIS